MPLFSPGCNGHGKGRKAAAAAEVQYFCVTGPHQAHQLQRYAAAAQAALDAGLGVNAGHDLNLHNLGAFVARVPGLLEVSIGHAFIADALERGYAATTEAYLHCIAQAAHS